MRRPAVYPQLRYRDPNDRRLVQVIRKSRTSQRDAVNIIGVPYDGAVLGRKGAAGGPAAIRQSLSMFSNFDIETGTDLLKSKIYDIGDISMDATNVTAAHSMVEREVESCLKATSVLAVLGGDNSVSLPSIWGCSKVFRKIGLIVVDSHLDLRGKIGGKPTSGSSYGLAIESVPALDPERVVEIGAHGSLNSRRYVEKAKRLGVEVIAAESLRKFGAEKIARRAYEIAAKGANAVYVSIDLDAVDLASVSGVSAPSVGGISAAELMALARYFASKTKVKCVDIVELAPSLDPTGRSQIVAATCLVNIISGFTGRRA